MNNAKQNNDLLAALQRCAGSLMPDRDDILAACKTAHSAGVKTAKIIEALEVVSGEVSDGFCHVSGNAFSRCANSISWRPSQLENK